MKRYVVSYGLQILGLGISYLSVILVSRSYSLESLGVFFIVLNSTTIAASIGNLGLPAIMLRTCSNSKLESIATNILNVLRKYIWSVLAVVSLTTSVLFYLQRQDSITGGNAVLINLAAFCFALSLILNESVRVIRGVVFYGLFGTVVRQFITLVMLVVGLEIVFALSFAFIFNFLVISLVVMKSLRSSDYLLEEGQKKTFNAKSEGVDEVKLLTILTLAEFTIRSLDILLVGYFGGNSEAGAYGTVSRYCMLINFSLITVTAVLGPRISRLATSNFANVEELVSIKRTVLYLRFGATIIAVVLFLCLPYYSWLMDIEMSKLTNYFYVVLVNYWLTVMLGPTAFVLIQSSKIKELLAFNSVAILLSLLITWFVYPVASLLTIPIVIGITFNLVKIFSLLYIRKEFKVWI